MTLTRTLLSLVACLTALHSVAAEDLRISVLVGQTGASQTFGRNETDGYTLAAEERNAKGGVNGKGDATLFSHFQNQFFSFWQVVGGMISLLASKTTLN